MIKDSSFFLVFILPTTVCGVRPRVFLIQVSNLLSVDFVNLGKLLSFSQFYFSLL